MFVDIFLCSDSLFLEKSYHLEFHLGRRQTSRTWHSHITLPLHSYYLARWSHYNGIRSENKGVAGEAKQLLNRELWFLYVRSRKMFLEDLSRKHIEYQKTDEAAIGAVLKTMVRV